MEPTFDVTSACSDYASARNVVRLPIKTTHAAQDPAGEELDQFAQIYGSSPEMRHMYSLIEKAAPTDAIVLIVGASGTGKELVAQAVHQLSRRRDEPFLAVNCGAIPATLIEAELFGYEKGSFTGAARQHQGYFERVSGGTLLLDEITEMPIEMQVKLLRVLETGRFLRVGGTQEITTHARIVAATNRDPNIAVAEGKIRQDLLYRLSVFPLHVPALYRRGPDIIGLARHFVAELNAEYGTQKRLSQCARSQLMGHTWPGNVRELKNVVHRAYILSAEEIEVEEALKTWPTVGCEGVDGSLAIPLGTSLPEAEQRIVLATLEHVGGNKRRAAQILGVSLKTLYNRLAHYQTAANLHRARQAVAGA